MNSSLNLELLVSDNMYMFSRKGKGELKLFIRICKSIEDFHDTGNINYNQLTKSYKMVVSFVLSNAEFPPLPTVFKLYSPFLNDFSDKRIYNTTT